MTYREQIRDTLQALSDQALVFQSKQIVGGIDREECDREIGRRADRAYGVSSPKHPDYHSVHADLYDSREGK